MYRNHTIAAVVPAYNEEALIGRVIETMPAWVDRIEDADNLEVSVEVEREIFGDDT
jgi:hypothetical protein